MPADVSLPGEDEQFKQRKAMLKAVMAAGAPALAAAVALVSTPRILQDVAGVGPLGLLSLAGLGGVLGYLLWRRHWWAGLPAIAAALATAAFTGYSLARPLAVYYSSNPPLDLAGLTAPLILLSPSLVLCILCLSLSRWLGRGMALARRLGSLPVSRHFWPLIALWLTLLLIDVTGLLA
ncbi:MAG: hypothetical protein V1797_12760 [Pseudomonadota bacterium]